MKKPNEDISKLPKWAQHRIAKLESDVEACRDILEGLQNKTGGQVTGKIIVEPYSSLATFMLRDRTVIRFYLRKDQKHYNRSYMDVAIRKGMLNINSAEGLIVLPGASNDINLAAVHWSDMEKVIEKDAD